MGQVKTNFFFFDGFMFIYMCQGLNSQNFHIIGDGHQPNSRGLYTHYKDSVIKGGMTIPNIYSDF